MHHLAEMIWVAFFATIAVALGVGLLRGHRSRSRQVDDPYRSALSTMVWFGAWVCGVAMTMVLVLVTLILVLRLVDGLVLTPRAIVVSDLKQLTGDGINSSLPDKAQGEKSAERGLAGDAVSNTLTAVSVAVAVVTLVLTGGTSWFISRQQEVDRRLQELKLQTERLRSWEGVERQRERVLGLLSGVKFEVTRWARVEGGLSGDTLTDFLLEVQGRLECLASPDAGARRMQFGLLCQQFHSDDPGIPLNALIYYFDECHTLAISRALRDGLIKNIVEVREFEAQGVWCRVFDHREVERFGLKVK
jgi:hypothetical protein